jgi:hypothetical protein
MGCGGGRKQGIVDYMIHKQQLWNGTEGLCVCGGGGSKPAYMRGTGGCGVTICCSACAGWWGWRAMCVMMKLWSLFIFMLLATLVATLCCMHLSPGYVSYVIEACDSGLVGCS